MKSETITIQQLFQDRRQYRVPFYQRAYVWNEEDQWDRLWSDIEDKADARVSGNEPTPHFLGAVVLEPQTRRSLIGVESLHIIDGQQRLTTLQYVLAALALIVRAEHANSLMSLIDACLKNQNAETMENPETEVFKVWPTFRDRVQYQMALTAPSTEALQERFPQSFTQSGTLRRIGIDHPPALAAIWYFHQRIIQWLDPQPAQRSERLQSVSEAVLRYLRLVTISLGDDDDAQVIFETLNGHGAELHATDLIRNFIFMRADRERADAATLYEALWTPFESAFWIEDQRRGRLKRPRLEWFVQTSLQVELGREVDVGRIYTAYRQFALNPSSSLPARSQLDLLNGYAYSYRGLVSGKGTDPIARFGRRSAAWDTSTTHSLALLIANSGVEHRDQAEMLDDLVSYLVRRAICGLTTKNYNKVFVQPLGDLRRTPLSPSAMRTVLSSNKGDVSRWPSDEEFRKSWLEAPIYPGRLDAARTRAVLIEIEDALRSYQSEEPISSGLEVLDIEHVLPTNWLEHWALADGTLVNESELTDAAFATIGDAPSSDRLASIQRRESAKVCMGNLTLLHYGVNRSLQHCGFGKKRDALFAKSNLHLNRDLMITNSWNEEAIGSRGRDLFEVALRIWRGPEGRA